MMIGFWIAIGVSLCMVCACGVAIVTLINENSGLVGELKCIKDCANDEVDLLNDKITELENKVEIEKIVNDNLKNKNSDLEVDIDKLNESIDSLMNENHQLHATVYKPRKCPFCGGDVDITINKGAVKNVYVKHKKHMADCPLNEGFTMCATNKIDAVSKWNTRVCG